eukprot:CAMPEP_0198289198 /NCGR_PEP_ID=MMETSP1449-20131203/7477_1 /TAXON_ID=420275 /ORGANISM="Attheya septentrionalis, Strain CCMP2084" /LENGTH=677 /DNA_ID=CAMNT_0043987495 /DNA_START=20 /DNA_END=2053 /DNA_ORIENTATION=-
MGKVSAESTASAAVRQNQPLENQKTAAQEAFKSCKLEPTNAVFNSINAQLAVGCVLPEYHAYITGAPTNSTMDPPIPSSDVEAGGEPMERVVNVIQDAEAMSELVVDGTPCLKFMEDHSMMWDYSKKASEAVVKLISTPSMMIGHGVEHTTIGNNFKIDNSKVGATNLLSRPESRGIVGKALTGQVRGTCEMVGSPGIGKSWSLLYALQQGCLFDGANVCLFVSNHKIAYLILRRGNKMYAWTRKHEGTASGPFFRREDVLVLYDPPESTEGGADYSVGERTLIAALSPNEKHFLKSVEKDDASVRRHIGPPTLEQITMMLPFIGTDDVNQAMLRIQEVGPLPRYIRSQNKYATRKRAFDALLSAMERNPSLLSDMIQNQGDDTMSTNTLQGTVFLIKPKILRGELSVEGQGYSYVEDDHEHENEKDDYDGRHFWTTERLIFPVSTVVRSKIMQQQRETILSYWGVVDASEFHAMGNKVKDLFLADLFQDTAITMMRRQQLKNRTADAAIAEDSLILPHGRICRRNVQLGDLGSIFRAQNVVAGMAKNTALIDAAGPGKQVEQVTVSDDHSFKQAGLISLLKSAGFLEENDGVLQMINVASPGKLDFYWVCPPARYAKWKNGAAKTVLVRLNRAEKSLPPDERKMIITNKATLKQCLETRVVQYALEMSSACPHVST